jgi:hypothetical protein
VRPDTAPRSFSDLHTIDTAFASPSLCGTIFDVQASVFNIGTLDPSAMSRTGDQMRTAEFDADQLELLIVAAFEPLGKPQGEAQELARSILRAAEQPQSGDPEPPNLDPT